MTSSSTGQPTPITTTYASRLNHATLLAMMPALLSLGCASALQPASNASSEVPAPSPRGTERPPFAPALFAQTELPVRKTAPGHPAAVSAQSSGEASPSHTSSHPANSASTSSSPASGAALSLDAALAYADEHSPGLIVARERLGLGDAAEQGAKPLLRNNPTVSFGIGPRVSSNGTYPDLQLGVSQRLEIAGERAQRKATAESMSTRLRAELAEARWEVHREVHAAFHRALVERESLVVAERLLRFQERLLEITQQRLAAGDVSPLAVRLAQGELSQAQVARIAAEQEYIQACLDLGQAAGFPGTSPPQPAGILDEPREAPDAETLMKLAWKNQPRLSTLRALAAEATARSALASREAWPEPTVGLKATREGRAPGSEETVVLGTLSLPLPFSERNQGARATSQAQLRVVHAELEAFERRLRIKIEQHRSAVAAAALRVRTYGSTILPTFEENLTLLQRAFELGEIDILQVSVARERFLRLQTDALAAYRLYFRAVANLEGSLGTDLWPDERHVHNLPDQEHP